MPLFRVLAARSLLALVLAGLFFTAFAQTAPKFDRISLKATGTNHFAWYGPSAPIPITMRGFRFDGGRVTCNLPLVEIIEEAFALKDFQIEGPEWIRDSTYALNATMPAATPKQTARRMLQSMLADHLGLRCHRERREIPIYEITQAKQGVKIKPVADLAKQREKTIDTPAGPQKGVAIARGYGSFHALAISMGDFATQLSDILGRPVVNRTELGGYYEIDLRWTPQSRADVPPNADLPGIMARQLGLSVETRKAPNEVLVIDAVTKTPSGN